MAKRDPYANINWTKREAKIVGTDGTVKFHETVEFPDYFDDNSVAIVASKYLCNSAKKKETSLKELIDRVSNTITAAGVKDGYFKDKKEADEFNYKLKYYQVHQYFAFNSPVYFNVGLREDYQASACFILDMYDNMDSIYDTFKLESRIFKQGSGAGYNLSHLRSKVEPISGGGKASGPVSFLKIADVSAGTIKSGGTLRRSAKLACLNIDHPDIEEFIDCKLFEEEKLKILRNNNIKAKPGHELGDEVFFQNTNISVRLTDEFMKSAEQDGDFFTKFVVSKTPCKKYKAKDLLNKIATRAWECADPGVQFHDITNRWNTCKADGEIEASNPCAEYVFLNNSACNLASKNLVKFFDKRGKFNIESFKDVIDVIVTAQDIIINNAAYPTEKIKENSIKYRPIGLGYTNLGALLMLLGHAYDSDEGRDIAAAITALMTGFAYLKSNDLAKTKGAFDAFERNKESFYDVMNQHYHFAISRFENLQDGIFKSALNIWREVADLTAKDAPFRNAQTTLLAPTGTISFMMGATTTGIEPEFSNIKYKNLSGTDGSCMKIVNPLIEETLRRLGYKENMIALINDEFLKNDHLEESQYLHPEHLPIFDTSVVPNGGTRSIHFMGHIKMLSAVQPFLSGAISKTVNLPNEISIEDTYNIYLIAWKLGLKGITVYRDGSKTFQALSTTKDENKKDDTASEYFTSDDVEELRKQLEAIKQKVVNRSTIRKRLSDERKAINHKFNIGTTKGYITTGLYDSGAVGEVFIKVAKQGSTLSGLLDALATITSISLQYGVPLKVLVRKLMYQRFDPSGFTSNENIRTTTSIVDYVFRYLGYKFLTKAEQAELGISIKPKEPAEPVDDAVKQVADELINRIFEENIELENEVKNISPTDTGDTSNSCPDCGNLMVRKGSCYFCVNCAFNEGSCG